MNCHYYQKTGGYHTENGAPCQDAFLTAESRTYTLIAIADGVSACRYGKMGAEKAVEALKDYFQTEGDRVFLCAPKKLAYLILEHVRYYLELAAHGEGADVTEFSSTLAFACVEKQSGRAIMGSLGDSTVMGFVQGKFQTVLAPGRRTSTPFVTTADFAEKAMTIRCLELFPGDSLLLGSDGFIDALGRVNGGKTSVLKGLERFGFGELDWQLEECRQPDDCTYVAMKRSRKGEKRAWT